MIRWLIHKLMGRSRYHQQANEVNVTRLAAEQARRRALKMRLEAAQRK